MSSQRGKSGDAQRLAYVNRDEQEANRSSDIQCDKQIQQESGQWNDHHPDNHRHQHGQDYVGIARKQHAHVASPQQRQESSARHRL